MNPTHLARLRKRPIELGRLIPAQSALNYALSASLRADCTRRTVGAAIVNADDGRLRSTGHNQLPDPARSCTAGHCPRGQFTHQQIPSGLGNRGHAVVCEATHAEAAAITAALARGVNPARALLAITTRPCPDCEALIRSTGLRSVVWLPDGVDTATWDGLTWLGWGPGAAETPHPGPYGP